MPLVYDTRNHLPTAPPAGWSTPIELVRTLPGGYAVLVDDWMVIFQMNEAGRTITATIGNQHADVGATDAQIEGMLAHVRACGVFREVETPPGVATQGKRMFRAAAEAGDPATWPAKIVREGDAARQAAALTEDQLGAMVWTEVETWRTEGKSLDDVFLAVFDMGSSPGFELFTTLSAAEDRTSIAEAEEKARSALRSAEGGRIQYQTMQTLDSLHAFLKRGGVEIAAKVDTAVATLPAKAPAAKLRVLVFNAGEVDGRLVDIRRPEVPTPSIHRTDEERRAGELQSLLIRCQDVILGLYQDRLRSGRAARNLAILVEQRQTGEVDATVELRTAIAALIQKYGPRAGAISDMLKKPAEAGYLHCVAVMWREANIANLACVQVQLR